MLPAVFLPHESIHFSIALFLSLLVFRKFRSIKLTLAVLAASFLVDLDHLFDYFYYTGDLKFWEYFLGMNIFTTSQKVFVLAHSWELAIFLGIWGWRRRHLLAASISLAIAGHLLVDQLTWTPNPLAYFLIFRAANNFSLTWFNGL